jgi:hypothetical protein
MRLLSSSEQGTFLKRKFYESRVSFTQWRVNWSQSGNYDVDSFERYVAQLHPGSTSFHPSRYAQLSAFTLRAAARRGSRRHDMEWVAKTGESDCMYDDQGGNEPDFTGFSQILPKRGERTTRKTFLQ